MWFLFCLLIFVLSVFSSFVPIPWFFAKEKSVKSILILSGIVSTSLIISYLSGSEVLRLEKDYYRLIVWPERIRESCIANRRVSSCETVRGMSFVNDHDFVIMKHCIENQSNTVDGCLEALKGSYHYLPSTSTAPVEIQRSKSSSFSVRVSSVWGESEFSYINGKD